MLKGSEILAARIDVLVAFQNGEIIQHRGKNSAGPWINTHNDSSLSFDFKDNDYRLVPPIREGFIFENQLHQHPTNHKWKKGAGTCFPVKEVEQG